MAREIFTPTPPHAERGVREHEPIPGTMAIVFSGQGLSKRSIMFDHLAELAAINSDVVQRNLQLMEDATALPLTRVVAQKNERALGRTDVVQPLVHASHLAAIDLLDEKFGGDRKQVTKVAGHSVGEIAALVYNRVLSKEDSAHVIANRSRNMHQDAQKVETGLRFIPGFDKPQTELVLADTMDLMQLYRSKSVGDIVADGTSAAEFFNNAASSLKLSQEQFYELLQRGELDFLSRALANEPAVHVFGATKGMLAIATEVATAIHGAERVREVDSEGAWHTPAMREAQQKFGSYFRAIELSAGEMPVALNDGRETTSPDIAREAHIDRMTQPSEWTDAMSHMKDIQNVVKVGPKGQVAGISRANGIPDERQKSIVPFLQAA